MYKTANAYYQEKFGCKVYKLSLDGGFTCPNRDGTCGERGCLFCSAGGSGDFAENAALSREKRRQQAVLSIRKKYGKNAILKGMNFEEGATTIDRNRQIGGHKA